MKKAIHTHNVSDFNMFAGLLKDSGVKAHDHNFDSTVHDEGSDEFDRVFFSEYLNTVKVLQIKKQTLIYPIVDKSSIEELENNLKEYDNLNDDPVKKAELKIKLQKLKQNIDQQIALQCQNLTDSATLQHYIISSVGKDRFSFAGSQLFRDEILGKNYNLQSQNRAIILESDATNSIIMTVITDGLDIIDPCQATSFDENNVAKSFAKVIDAKGKATATFTTEFRLEAMAEPTINLNIKSHKEEIFHKDLANLTKDYQKKALKSYAKSPTLVDKIKLAFAKLRPFGVAKKDKKPIKKTNSIYSSPSLTKPEEVAHHPKLSRGVSSIVLGDAVVADAFVIMLTGKINSALGVISTNYLEIILLLAELRKLQNNPKQLDLLILELGQNKFNSLLKEISAIATTSIDLNNNENYEIKEKIVAEAAEILNILNAPVIAASDADNSAILTAIEMAASRNIPASRASVSPMQPAPQINNSPRPAAKVAPLHLGKLSLFRSQSTACPTSMEKTKLRPPITTSKSDSVLIYRQNPLLQIDNISHLIRKIEKAFSFSLVRIFKGMNSDYSTLLDIFNDIAKLSNDDKQLLSQRLSVTTKSKLVQKARLLYQANQTPATDLNDEHFFTRQKFASNALKVIQLFDPNGIISEVGITEREKKQIEKMTGELATEHEQQYQSSKRNSVRG